MANNKPWKTFFISISPILLILIILIFCYPQHILILILSFLTPIAMIYIWALTSSFQEKSNINQIRREHLLHNTKIYAPILGELKTIIEKLTYFREDIQSSEIRKIHQQVEWWQIDPDFVDKFNKLEGGLKGYNDLRKKCYLIYENYFKEEFKKFKLGKNKKDLKGISRIGVSQSKEIFLSILNSDGDKLKELLSWGFKNLNNKKAIRVFLAEEYVLNHNDFMKTGMKVFNKFKLIKKFEELRRMRMTVLDFIYQLQKELGEAVREPWKVFEDPQE